MMEKESGISRILRNLGYGDDGGVIPAEVDPPIVFEESDLVSHVNEMPLHDTLYGELNKRRQDLYLRDGMLTAEINSKHEELASTKIAIRAIEASIDSIRKDPGKPQRILSEGEMRQKKTNTDPQ